MDEFGGPFVLIVLILVLVGTVIAALAYGVFFILRVLYMIVASLGCVLMTVLDNIFLGRLVAGHPEIGWALSGLILGAGAGFYTVAPNYGLQRLRKLGIILPLCLMLLAGATGFANRNVEVPMPGLGSSAALVPAQRYLPLSFEGLEQSPDQVLAVFSIGDQRVSRNLDLLGPYPGQGQEPWPDSASFDLNPVRVEIAARHGGPQSDDRGLLYKGHYEIRVRDQSRVICLVLLNDQGKFETSSNVQQTGDQLELPLEAQEAGGLFGLARTPHPCMLVLGFKPEAAGKYKSGRGQNASWISFPQGMLELELKALPRDFKGVLLGSSQEQAQIARAAAQTGPIEMRIRPERAEFAYGGVSRFPSVYFGLNGETSPRVTPITLHDALQYLARDQQMPNETYVEIPEQINRLNLAIAACVDEDRMSSSQELPGVYLLQIYSRPTGRSKTIQVDENGALQPVEDWVPDQYVPRMEGGALVFGGSDVGLPARQQVRVEFIGTESESVVALDRSNALSRYTSFFPTGTIRITVQ